MSYKKRLTNGNSKISKQVLLFSLPPVSSCLNSSSCSKNCYAMKSFRQYEVVRNLWNGNFDTAKNNPFQLYSDISKQLNSSRKTIIRVHQSGDFFSPDYIDMWFKIAQSFPDKFFYGYSKTFGIFGDELKRLNCLQNVNIINSMVDNDKPNFGSMNYIKRLQNRDYFICPATVKKGVICMMHCSACLKKSKVCFNQH